MGLLERCHSYKDKTARGLEATHGLFAYPVLMAADILIYNSDIVPVGEDQKQHLEVTRDIAMKFNNRYGEVFTIPKARIREQKAKVPGLDGSKMSKSYGNTLDLFGAEKATRKRIMSIVTDSTPVEAPKDPKASVIIDLYKLVADEAEVATMENEFRNGGVGYGDFKKRLFEAFSEHFAPMRKRRDELLADPGYVEGILSQGAERARSAALETLRRARQACGIGSSAS